MTPHEWNSWIAFLILGVPLIITFGGPFAFHAAIILASLALFVLHPVAALAIGAAWLLLGPLRFVLLWFVGGFALGEGLKLSGLFRPGRPPPPRRYPGSRHDYARAQRFRRPPRGYHDDFEDDFPSNLEGRE